jgi:hypothetical protein
MHSNNCSFTARPLLARMTAPPGHRWGKCSVINVVVKTHEQLRQSQKPQPILSAVPG